MKFIKFQVRADIRPIICTSWGQETICTITIAGLSRTEAQRPAGHMVGRWAMTAGSNQRPRRGDTVRTWMSPPWAWPALLFTSFHKHILQAH